LLLRAANGLVSIGQPSILLMTRRFIFEYRLRFLSIVLSGRFDTGRREYWGILKNWTTV
jgi:hypothetical protein